MKALIIEDEPALSASLERQLRSLRPDITICGPLASVQEGLAYLSNHTDLDIIFSDIRLKDGLSFSIYDKEETDAMIVFTTAYDEYAVKAFEYNCADYLLKPIGNSDLERALAKCESGFSRLKRSQLRELSLDIVQGTVKYRKRIFLECGRDIIVVPVDDISYIFTERGITMANLKDGSHGMVSKSLSELFSGFAPDQFFRANRQTIVNLDCIERVSRNMPTSPYLVMRSPYQDITVSLSPEKASEIIKKLDS